MVRVRAETKRTSANGNGAGSHPSESGFAVNEFDDLQSDSSDRDMRRIFTWQTPPWGSQEEAAEKLLRDAFFRYRYLCRVPER